MPRAIGVFNKKIQKELEVVLEQGQFNGFCYCGCGCTTALATTTRKDRNGERTSFAGYPTRYLSGHEPQVQKGKDSPFYLDVDRKQDCYGYWWVRKPEHPRARDGFVKEHIVIMEGIIGRSLKKEGKGPCIATDEVVHHIDRIKSNNEPSNLRLMTHAAHVSLHRQQDNIG